MACDRRSFHADNNGETNVAQPGSVACAFSLTLLLTDSVVPGPSLCTSFLLTLFLFTPSLTH